MSNNKHLNLDQLVIAVILSSSKTKQDIDQLIKEVCKLAVSKKYLPVEELCLQCPRACYVLQEVLHLFNFLQNTINDCLFNLKRYYVDQWSTDGFKEFQDNYSNHVRNTVPSDFSNAVAVLAQCYTEVMENFHCEHDIGMKDTEKNQNSHDTIAHGFDVKLQQEIDGLGTNLFKVITSLVEENWGMLNKTCMYSPDKTCTLKFRMPTVIWPIAVQYDLVLLRKILRNKRKIRKQSEPKTKLRLQSAVLLQSLATHDVVCPVDPSPSARPLRKDQSSDLTALPAHSCLQIKSSAQILSPFPAPPSPDFSPLQPDVSSSQPHSYTQSLHSPSAPSSPHLLLQATTLPTLGYPSVRKEAITLSPSGFPPVPDVTVQQPMHQILHTSQSFPQALPVSDTSSFLEHSSPQVLSPPDMLPPHCHPFAQILPDLHTSLSPCQSSEINSPQKMCSLHNHSYPRTSLVPDMPPFHTYPFPHTPLTPDMPPFHTCSFPHTLLTPNMPPFHTFPFPHTPLTPDMPPFQSQSFPQIPPPAMSKFCTKSFPYPLPLPGMSLIPAKYFPQALPPSYMFSFSTRPFPQTLSHVPGLSSLSAQSFQQHFTPSTAQCSQNILSFTPKPLSHPVQSLRSPQPYQQASPPLSLSLPQAQSSSTLLSLPQAQSSSTLPPNPDLPSSPIQPLMSHMTEGPQAVYPSVPSQPHPLPARKEKISSTLKEFHTEVDFTEDSYIPFVTKSQVMADIKNLPDREQCHKNIPLPESSDNSVTSKRSFELHQSTKISRKEEAEKKCEENCKSRSESQKDCTCVWATSNEQGAGIPKKQHTDNPQEDMNTIQCFSEDIDGNLDCISEEDVVPVYALPMVELPLPYIMPKEHVEEAVLSHVQNPGHFYLVLGKQGNLMVERLLEDLQDRYKDDDEPLKVWELPLGSCWAARWTDGCWYRVKVIANIAPLKVEREEWQVRVLLVDSGEEGVIPTQNIRVLHDPFTVLPCYALPCHLAEIYPVCAWENEPWPASTTHAFVDMCLDSVSPLTAYVLSKHLNGTYGVILERRDGEVVNLKMVHDGLAVSKLLKEVISKLEKSSIFPSQLQGLLENQETETEFPNDWDPMSEDFKSSSNTILLNDECAETMFLGWRNTDGERQCKYHRAGRQCPRGETCPWEHTPVRDDITVEKEMVLSESFLPSALPTQGSLLAAIVTSVTSPSSFYIHLPYGTKNLTALGHEGSDDNSELEVLVSAMQKFYGQRGHAVKSLSLPAPGELLVLLESGSEGLDCSRVLVLEVNDCKKDACQVKVFFIDFGHEEWVKQEMLQPLAVQFAHVLPHAVECWLSGVNTPAEGWSAEATEILREMIEEHTLVAHILQVDSNFQRVGVELIDTEGKQKLSINEDFVSRVC
ncbi:uncharacterized protein LOC123516972 isoform X2 [Portunus trituberculatus]|nr:uncharacterized protein LOC123516972 isoform X2 [Portunus trituberculatus]